MNTHPTHFDKQTDPPTQLHRDVHASQASERTAVCCTLCVFQLRASYILVRNFVGLSRINLLHQSALIFNIAG